jgi:hypothetical protein
MIRLITLPLKILRLPVYDAAALLGDCFAIQPKEEESEQPQRVYRMNLEGRKSVPFDGLSSEVSREECEWATAWKTTIRK